MTKPMNIAMWSGPRNLSTAMMYSFAQRDDCDVIDEPFYAAYLQQTQLPHPMADSIIRNGESNHDKVADICGQTLGSSPLFYQKHITKHLLPEFPRKWLQEVANIFLIRHPARVICSYHVKDENPKLSDIGVKEQWEIYQYVAENSTTLPVVIDSADILAQPRLMLTKLCHILNIPFQEAMLSWPEGPKSYDGIWASHWYHSVWNSEGFTAPPGGVPQVPVQLHALLEKAMPYYEQLSDRRIVP